MNVKQISYGLLGSLMTLGVCTGCVDEQYSEKAKAQAVKYLKGDELLKAERFANQQYNSDNISGKAVTYWDSLLTEAKAKQAYLEGQQLIRDSIKGIHHRKTKFNAPLDTIITNDIIDSPREEYAKYVSAEEFINARNNAPDDYDVKLGYNDFAGSTHYWNLITMAGRQQEAFNKGMADERAKLNEAKVIRPIDPLVKVAIDAYNSTVTKDVIDKSAIIEVYKNIK